MDIYREVAEFCEPYFADKDAIFTAASLTTAFIDAKFKSDGLRRRTILSRPHSSGFSRSSGRSPGIRRTTTSTNRRLISTFPKSSSCRIDIPFLRVATRTVRSSNTFRGTD